MINNNIYQLIFFKKIKITKHFSSKLRKILFLFAFLILELSAVFAQNKIPGNKIEIWGRIISSSGEALPSVRVFINELKKQTFSNSAGRFEISNLTKGIFKLSFRRIGYLTLDTLINTNDNNYELLITLKESDIITGDVVVTGTRSYKYIENLPIPIDVVPKSEIQEEGYTRLDEVISQQVGLPIVEQRGRGVQMQGLDADFTLILINGEPLTGRTGGILDITRFNISNVDRVEVVRGPSSSLYGSNALAGVINLITEKPTKPLSIMASARYGNFNTSNLTGEIKMTGLDKKFGMSLYMNRYSSEGYSINSSVIRDINTIPRNNDYTLNGELFYEIGSNTLLRFSGKNYNEEQQNKYLDIRKNLNSGNIDTSIIGDNVNIGESNLSFNINHKFSNSYSLEARFYGTRYITTTDDKYSTTGGQYDYYQFEQRTGKAEIQSTALLGSHQIIGGFGTIWDQALSARIANGKQTLSQTYGYLQEDWQTMNTLDIIGSLRYDNSNLYADNLSPKLAASWKPVSDLTLRASIGTGYKSPDFEQLYLNWTNTTEGYTVLGAKFVDDGLKQLAASGQISDSIIKNIHVNPLQPEKSIAFDIGGTYSSNDFYEIRINIFRNNITNLIDFLRLAVKSNGQNLDTYTNVSKMLSQGAEIKLRVNPLKYFAVDISYQYLETADDNVVDSIKSGKIITRDVNNVERKMTLADYGGLFNRSKHSGVIKFIYSNEELGLISSLRSIFRGKYGLADANGNLILDDPREYAPGYAIWNFTVSKQLIKYFIIQGGIDNIFNKKGPNTQFITPGTTVFVNLTFNYNLD